MKYFIPVIALVLLSCGGGGNKEGDQTSSSEGASGGSSCLAEMTDPTLWLPLATAADVLALPQDQIKQKAYKEISCQYSWKSDRTYTMKVGNNDMVIDANNKIGLSIKNLDEVIEKWLSKSYVKQTEMSYVEYFDKFHGASMTKEDKAQVNKKLDEKAAKDEDFDEQKAEVAKGVLVLAKTENYGELNDLGDKANYYTQLAPNLRELRLAVLHGNAVLTIAVDASDDDAEDLAIARAVAEAMMAQCN